MSQPIFRPFRACSFSAGPPGLTPWAVFFRRFAAVFCQGHGTSVHLRRPVGRETISAKRETLCQNKNIGSTAIRIAIAANARNPNRAAPTRDLRRPITSGRDRYSLLQPTRYRAVGNAVRCSIRCLSQLENVRNVASNCIRASSAPILTLQAALSARNPSKSA